MKKEWLSFRLTLLLYSIVFIIPLTFYFVYTSFDVAEDDTKVIRQIGWVEGVSESMAIAPVHQFDPQMIKKTDDILQKIFMWVVQNNNSKFYQGRETLSEDFSKVITCWTVHKQTLAQSNNSIVIDEYSTKCSHLVTDLTTTIENMVYQKQNKLINTFYWNLIAAMFLSWLIIYMVRSYIRMQMNKDAIYDHETNLFNRKYFLAELETSCARSVRYGYPLSMLAISIDGFEEGNENYDKKVKIDIFEKIGGLISFLTRTSDIACRYSKDHIFILLPDTEKENALILENRIRKALEKYDFTYASQVWFRFSTTQFCVDETPLSFVARTHDSLN